MESQIARLLKFIEETRKELNQLGMYKPLTDPEVINLSQRLDLLLNEYQKHSLWTEMSAHRSLNGFIMLVALNI